VAFLQQKIDGRRRSGVVATAAGKGGGGRAPTTGLLNLTLRMDKNKEKVPDDDVSSISGLDIAGANATARTRSGGAYHGSELKRKPHTSLNMPRI